MLRCVDSVAVCVRLRWRELGLVVLVVLQVLRVSFNERRAKRGQLLAQLRCELCADKVSDRLLAVGIALNVYLKLLSVSDSTQQIPHRSQLLKGVTKEHVQRTHFLRCHVPPPAH